MINLKFVAQNIAQRRKFYQEIRMAEEQYAQDDIVLSIQKSVFAEYQEIMWERANFRKNLNPINLWYTVPVANEKDSPDKGYIYNPLWGKTLKNTFMQNPGNIATQWYCTIDITPYIDYKNVKVESDATRATINILTHQQIPQEIEAVIDKIEELIVELAETFDVIEEGDLIAYVESMMKKKQKRVRRRTRKERCVET